MTDLAIIGMACRFPGADNVEQFWQQLCQGKDLTGQIPPERQPSLDNMPGGYLNKITDFDAAFFDISDLEAQKMDPQQRLLLQHSWQALEDANIVPSTLNKSSTGVFIGVMNSEWSQSQLTDLDNIDVYTGVGNGHCLLANRISYHLGLRGPSMAVDTACSSSLTALDLAAKAFNTDDCNLALVGGVNLILTPSLNIFYQQAGLASKSGKCQSFGKHADGIIRAEGVGVIVIKKLSDAIAAQDNIYAVIKSTAVNHDGTSNGFTAPNRFAQIDVLEKAYQRAKVDPLTVNYIEAHGTGTVMGDPIEANALHAVLNKENQRQSHCLLGSVKSNIGHAEGAAGIAGLIKTALILSHGKVPASLHCEEVNSYINLRKLKLSVVQSTSQLPKQQQAYTAGVSSFGLGGANAHVVLQQYKENHLQYHNAQFNILKLSAKSASALQTMGHQYLTRLTSSNLANIALTTQLKRQDFHHRQALAFDDQEDLAAQLKSLTNLQTTTQSKSRKKIAFLFSGQGSQYSGMAKSLFQQLPQFQAVMQTCDAIYYQYYQHSLLDIIFTSDDETLQQTHYTQPALFFIEYSLAQVLLTWGVKPDYMLGHSIGEYVAACIAEVMSLNDAIYLVSERGRLFKQLKHQGAMLAINHSDHDLPSDIEQCLQQQLDIAAINTDDSFVVAGNLTSLNQLTELLDHHKIAYRPLKTSHAFHSRLLKSISQKFFDIASGIKYQHAKLPYISNLNGKVIDQYSTIDAAYWQAHLLSCVQFKKGVATLIKQHCQLFIEVGPHASLINLIRRQRYKNISLLTCLNKHQEDMPSMSTMLSKIYNQGINLNWQKINNDQQSAHSQLPTYPFDCKQYSQGTTTYDVSQTNTHSQTNTAHPIADSIIKNVAHILGVSENEVQLSENLKINYAIDSLMILKLKSQLEKEHDVVRAISLTDFVKFNSLADLANHIADLQQTVL